MVRGIFHFGSGSRRGEKMTQNVGWGILDSLVYKFTNTMAQVTIYSTPTCHFCQAAKAFFKEEGVEYEDIDVASDAEKRQEMIELTGQMGVPVIKIGEEVIVGFDEGKVKEMLGK